MRTERGKTSMIKFSAPGKIHLLGEHTVVYGKPALLAAVNRRITVTLHPLTPSADKKYSKKQDLTTHKLRIIVEKIVKDKLRKTKIPPYQITISSQIPEGSGLGSSAAVSAAYLGALITFLGYPWDLKLINELTFEAEKVFHGNPSGADNSTVVFGGLVWFRKETPDLKLIQPLNFTIPQKLAKDFCLINTGIPTESTKEMIASVKKLYEKHPNVVKHLLEDQEKLVRKLLAIIKEGKKNDLIRIIKEGEKNLEIIGVCSPLVKEIIRKIEATGGAAKICGGGGKTKATGVLLAYHPDRVKVEKIAKLCKLPYFNAEFGVEGLRQET